LLVVTITVAVAAAAVLAAIFAVALGRGGQLSVEHPDHPPLALPGRRAVGGTDAALLRLPLGLWGYHKQITDEALERFAYELTERDTRIAVLEQALAEARQGHDTGTGSSRAALPPAVEPVPVTRTDVRPTWPGAGGDASVTRTETAGAGEAARPVAHDSWETVVDRDEDAEPESGHDTGRDTGYAAASDVREPEQHDAGEAGDGSGERNGDGR
jgi:hypothetical protein